MDDWGRGVSGTVIHDDRIVHVEHVWNTAISITIAATDRSDEALAAIAWCSDFFAIVDRTFSTYQPQTETSFYRNGLSWQGHQSPMFVEVLSACSRLRDATAGAFDPWSVPGGFDPSGYVKGWAAGQSSAHLTSAGFAHHIVNAGGDICAVGDEVPGSGLGWPVGILSPHAHDQVVEVVSLRDQSMATSGRYERGDHVIDPRSGSPAVGVDSATVVGPDPGAADAFASAAMVNGRDAMRWFADLGPEWSLHLVVGEVAFTYGTAFDLA